MSSTVESMPFSPKYELMPDDDLPRSSTRQEARVQETSSRIFPRLTALFALFGTTTGISACIGCIAPNSACSPCYGPFVGFLMGRAAVAGSAASEVEMGRGSNTRGGI